MGYALADLWRDRIATFLTIALFAAIMAPPALLYTAKTSLISAWTEEIARDVSNREVLIRGGKSSRSFVSSVEIREIRSWPETGFLAPEPSFSVRAHDWARVADDEMLPARASYKTLGMRTTLPGDPVFRDLAVPHGTSQAGFSAQAAERIGIKSGDSVMLMVTRDNNGRTERDFLELRVVSVLDEADWPYVSVFVAPELARAIRAYKYHKVSRESFPAPIDLDTASWASIRIYATSIHQAEALRDRLRAYGFADTQLHSDQIERLSGVKEGINTAFALVLGLGVLGFLASLFFIEWLLAERKIGDLALLSVLGFGIPALAVMRLTRTLILVGSSLLLVLSATFLAYKPLAKAGAELLRLQSVHPIPIGDLLIGTMVGLVVGALGSIYATVRIDGAELTAAIRKD